MSALAAGGFEPTDVMMEKPNTSYFTKYTHSLAASQLTVLWDVLTHPLCSVGARLPRSLSSVTTAESPKADEIKGNPHCSEVPQRCLGRSAATVRGRKCCCAKKGEEMLLRAYPGSEVEFWGEEGDKVTRKDIAIVV